MFTQDSLPVKGIFLCMTARLGAEETPAGLQWHQPGLSCLCNSGQWTTTIGKLCCCLNISPLKTAINLLSSHLGLWATRDQQEVLRLESIMELNRPGGCAWWTLRLPLDSGTDSGDSHVFLWRCNIWLLFKVLSSPPMEVNIMWGSVEQHPWTTLRSFQPTAFF